MAAGRSEFQRRLDALLRGLFFEENGRPRSASLLYSFLFSFLFLAVYAAAYLLLLGPLEALFSGASVPVRNFMEYVLPALAGSCVCLTVLLLLREKRAEAVCAYLWMGILLLGIMLFELFLIDWSDARTEYGLFMALIGLPGILSVLTGGIPALLIRRRDKKRAASGGGYGG